MTRLCRLTPAICAFHLGFSLDFVLEIGDQQIPVQVNYRRSIDPVGDTRGIRAFVDDPRIIAMPLSTFMLLA